jgi:hypothetical protein
MNQLLNGQNRQRNDVSVTVHVLYDAFVKESAKKENMLSCNLQYFVSYILYIGMTCRYKNVHSVAKGSLIP